MLPTLVKFSFLTLYSYPLFMGLAWGFAYYYCESQKENGFTSKQFQIFFWGNFLASWIGSKIFFLLFSGGERTLLYAESSNFWLGGGFVFYGGLVFCLLFNFIYLRTIRLPLTSLIYYLPAVPLAHGIGRVGCLLAGCCYGAITDSFVGVHLHGLEDGVKVIPVQIFESAICLGIGLSLIKLVKQNKLQFALPFYLSAYGLSRFLLEYLRGDEVRGRAGYFTSSQYVSIMMIVLAVLLYFKPSSKEQSFS